MILGAGASCGIGSTGDLPMPANDIALTAKPELRKAVLASGCFWCTEAVFDNVRGVSHVESGYAGGTRETANYKAVCGGDTDHAECVEVTYDASQVTFGRLLRAFFTTHDPTTLNRQGPDQGRQYRSAIFYGSEDEKRVAQAYIHQLDQANLFASPIVTSLQKLTQFFPAEAYHQDYARLNPLEPYIQRYALPKAKKAKENFSSPSPTTQPAQP